MNATTGLDFASVAERVQSEVQRAIQRSIKGAEYFSTSGPTLGSTPKDVLHSRGTMSLYHYRPMSDEIYRVPVLIVMATTNRGYILDMVPGQRFIVPRVERMSLGVEPSDGPDVEMYSTPLMLRWIARCTSDWIRSGIASTSRLAAMLMSILRPWAAAAWSAAVLATSGRRRPRRSGHGPGAAAP